jgi:hypothetical protein
MVLVARNQQNGVVVVIGVRAIEGDLPTVVDLYRLNQLNAGVGSNQSIQVYEGAAILPQEWECSATTVWA